MRKLLLGAAALAMVIGGVAAADTSGQKSVTVGPNKVITSPNGPGSGYSGTQGPGQARGTVAKVHGDHLTLSEAVSRQNESLYVDSNTAIVRSGRTAKLSELKPGDDVRASYEMRGQRPYALTITATPEGGNPKASNPHGTRIQQPVVGQPSTGSNTQISHGLYDDSVTGNAPGMQYRKESGRQPPNTNNAGIQGNIGVPANQPPGTPNQAGQPNASGQPVNPPSNSPQGR